ncbi:DUF2637 domain-containing protein [Streptomyces sp. NPDC098085]|uniref:DUF2637 domain-containing protein n=1 Tax=Streptomyces sp. NPDC098085 TaxID=3366094 RepID=UPI0038169B08
MNDTLTDAQDPATWEAVAGAAPETAGATPDARTATPVTTTNGPPAPRKGGREAAGVADASLSTAPAASDAAPATVATPQAGRSALWVGRLLMAVAVVGMPLVGIIGFASSYSTLRGFAADHGFSDTGWTSLAPWFPIGIDASIVALLAMDLVMVRRGTPWPVLRFAAHGMTLATVVFNASTGIDTSMSVWDGLWADPLRALSHAVMPVLFVLGIEGSRRILMHAARIAEGTASDRIPLHRWVLAPVRTPRLYRRMRLAAVRSYPEMVAREQALAGYRVWLTQELKGDLSKASETQMLPITMAPHGYTVEEALSLPAKWEAEAAERVRKEAERVRKEAERQREQAKADRIAAITDEGEIAEAEHQAAARTGTAAAQATAATATAQAEAEAARVRAELQRTAAERRARAEAEAGESAEAAADRRKAAEDNRKAAEAEAEAAEARRVAAHAALNAERQKAETDRVAGLRAAQRREAAVNDREAAEAERAANLARLQAGELEVRAQKTEDYARLSPRERSERRVARMIQAAGGDVEAVPLKDIMGELSVKQTAAGDIRIAAVELLKGGYQPDPILDAAV